MITPLIVLAGAVAVFTGTSLFCDVKTRRIPNWLTVTAFVLGLAFHTVTGGLSGLGFALGGFAVGFGILLVLWLVGGGGGGDVKMMGALGAWLGAPLTLIVFVASGVLALLAVIVATVWKMVARASTDAPTDGGEAASDKLNAARQVLPYAVPVTIATWAVMAVKLVSVYAR